MRQADLCQRLGVASVLLRTLSKILESQPLRRHSIAADGVNVVGEKPAMVGFKA